MPNIELVLGGARSGKSRYAGERAAASGLEVCYVATAEALDDEMAARIRQHRAERPAHWQTVEAPRDLAAQILRLAQPQRCVLVDCLTLWLSNLILATANEPAQLEIACKALCTALAQAGGPLILVSNEVGLGLVPQTALGRAFRDAQGRLNQDVAQLAQHVVFVAAGLPLRLKG